MNSTVAAQELRSLILGLGFAATTTFAVAYLSATPSQKLMAAAVGGVLLLVAGFISGRPRLFMLYGLALTMPFDLSKRFGTVIEKMGGESSFRVEFSDPFLIGLLLYLAADVWRGRLAGIRIPKVTLIWGVIILIGIYTAAVGAWRLTALHEVVRMTKVALLFLVVTNELRTRKRILHTATALAVGVLVQSGAGMYQYLTKSHLGLEMLGETGGGTMDQLALTSLRSAQTFRAGAFLSHPNLFGIFLGALLPLMIGAYLAKTGKFNRLLYMAVIPLGMAALIGTGSRSGWVSFAAGFFTLMGLMFLNPASRRRSILGASMASAAFLAVCLIFSGPILERVTQSREGAMISRTEYMVTAVGMMRVKPLMGWGMNSYVYAAPPFTKYGQKGARLTYANWLPPVHNIYLLWGSELGLVGLALHLLVWGGIVRIGIRNCRITDEVLFIINAGCLAAMAAFFVDGFFSFSLRSNSILRTFFILSGIILAIHYWRLQHSRPRLEGET